MNRRTDSRALVLGGGGVAGIAWESGLLIGLMAAGIDLTDADLVVGTSAGSAVAVLLRSGQLTEENFRQMSAAPDPDASAVDQQGGEALAFDGTRFTELMQSAAVGGGDDQQARARIGERARTVQVSLPQEAWVARMSSISPSGWPAGRLGITAVDAEDGTFKVLDADSGVPIGRAVAASCTVPTVYPLVEIDGRLHMDGGMRSSTNADVAAGHGRVLVVSCGPEAPTSPFGPTLEESMQRLQSEGQAMLISADQASLRAFGSNVLDPSTSEPAFAAGWAQAQQVADQVRAFWQD